MTVRITSFQSSPATTFELEADVVETTPDYGDHGRWRVRFYLNAENGPGGSSGSGYFGSGTQIGRYGNSNAEFDRHSGNPFLPSGVANGARRWREGPTYEYVNANSNGFYSGDSSGLPLRMDIDYGSVDVSPDGYVIMGRISREPGMTPSPNFSGIVSNGVTVSWDAAERGNSNIDNYQVQFSESSSFSDADTASTGTTRFYTSTSRRPGNKYYVRVRAHSNDGYGAWSPTKSFETPAEVPSSAFYSSITVSSAVATWDAPFGNVSGYQFRYSTSSSMSSPTVISAGTARTATMTGLTPGDTYYGQVRALASGGDSAWSSVTSFTTLPGAPGAPSFSAINPTTATVSWSAPSGVVLEYRVQYSKSSSFSSPITVSAGSSTSEGLTGLTPGTPYYVRVQARSAAGWGNYSVSRSFTTLPAAPGTPTLSSITPTSVTISWTTPAPSTDLITGYEYQVSTVINFSSVFDSVVVGDVNSDNTANDMTLTPGTVYYYRVRARIGSTSGPWSGTRSSQTIVASPPNISILSAPSGATATVVLTPPSGISTVNSYTVERRRQGTTTPVTTTTTTSNQLTVTGLTPGVTYEYRALANIGGYDSPWSAWKAQKQPKPSIDAGDYFDGNSPDTVNDEFRWTGATNNSTSQVVGEGVLNWEYVGGAGGAGVVSRVIGGWSGAYAARMLVTVPPTAAGMRWGQENNASPSPVVAGEIYYASAYVNPSRQQRLSAEITWLDENLDLISRSVSGKICEANEWTRVAIPGIAPANAEFALVRIIDVIGDGWVLWQSGDYILGDAMMLTLQDLFPYFDGSFEDTQDYTFAWEGAAHNSDSTRTIVTIPDAPTIRDPDCEPLPTPPRPPKINSDCISVTGVWRRYWGLIPDYRVSDTLHTLPAIRVTTEAFALRQLRVRFFKAVQGQDDPDGIDPSTWESEMVVSYVPPNSVLLLDSIEQSATISVNGSAPAEAGHLLYGSNGAPVIWPTLNCNTNYFVAFDTPTNVPIGNQTFEVVLTQKY
jgi:hypothetical protein